MRATAIAIACLCASAAAARASDDAEAWLEKGVQLFNQGEFERSLQALKRAEPGLGGAVALARLYLHMGLDHAFLGKAARARQAFQVALGHDARLDLDPKRIKEAVVRLFRQVRAGMRGELHVETNVEDARVWLDGRDAGPAPLERKLPIGTHVLEVRAPDGRARRAEVVVGAGPPTLVRLDLPARATPAVGPAVGALVVRSHPSGASVWLDGRRAGRTPLSLERLEPGEHEVALRAEGLPAQTRQLVVRAGRTTVAHFELGGARVAPGDRGGFWRRRRTWTWVAAGGAVVCFAVGAGLLGSGSSDYDTYRSLPDGTAVERAKLGELADTVRAKYRASWAMFGIAGALAAGGVALLFLEGRPRAEPGAPRARAGFSPGGLALDVRF